MTTKRGDHNGTISQVYSTTAPRITGAGASAVKYDILTALLVTAGQDSTPVGRLAARLALVITARFNWRLGCFYVGQKELARMWGVSERTAKREMAHMRHLGWISVEKPAVRGRVAQHRIEFPVVLRSTAMYWAAVGPDFEARLTGTPETEDIETNVVPIHHQLETNTAEDGSEWGKVKRILQEQDAGLFTSWFANLAVIETNADRWTFVAPSRFAARYIDTHLQGRLLLAISMIDRTVTRVSIISEDI